VTAAPRTDLLCSYAFWGDKPSTDILHNISGRLNGGGILIDSGAYTAHTTGKTIAVDDYITWLHDNHQHWRWAINLDVMGDHHATATNQHAMETAGIRAWPVYHYGSPLTHFDAYAEQHPIVAVGAIVTSPLRTKQKMMARYLATLVGRATKYGSQVHALGVGGIRTLLDSGVYSADSSGASRAPATGQIPVWNGRKMVSIAPTDTATMLKMAPMLRRLGFPVERLAANRRWDKDMRSPLVTASAASYSIAWAELRQRHPIPPPATAPDGWPTGTVYHHATIPNLGEAMILPAHLRHEGAQV